MTSSAHTTTALSLHLSPIITSDWIWTFAIIGMAFILICNLIYKRNLLWRVITFCALFLLLLNPSLLEEQKNITKDTAFIIVDKSESQNIGKRKDRTSNALAYLRQKIEKDAALDLKIIESSLEGKLSTDTRLFSALDTAIANIPQKQRAGVILLTDGQIHDVPQNENTFKRYGPIHALLTGEKKEKDRQLVITKAPAYGLVGKEISISYRVEDTNNISDDEAQITVTTHEGKQIGMIVPTNTEQTLILNLEHSGENVFMIEADGVKQELTLANNKAAIVINGVRDRLKVLLVSGVPHAGERPWRDLLTSDPGVDLVHFTILREPDKFDFTPQHELSLIAFPVQELFEEKLYDFDLIIFDHYRQNNILPDYYFENIIDYIKRGGAFLEASSPSYAGRESLYTTPMKEILPAAPTGEIFTQPYKPEITDLGFKHPVTSSLIWNNREIKQGEKPTWGNWLRQIEIKPIRGDVLMTGAHNAPLIILDRVEKGRIAQIASDHLWLWSRGYDGGGPHAELLRRTVHWLMKEPELDERALDVKVHENTITLRKQDFNNKAQTIAVKSPDGELSTIDLKPDSSGWLSAKITAQQLGIYSFEDVSGAKKYAFIGDINPQELRSVKTTDEKLKPIISASGGTTIWLEDTSKPVVKYIENSEHFGGSNWLAFRKNKGFTITGVKETPLLPDWLKLFLILFLLLFLWWREGKA